MKYSSLFLSAVFSLMLFSCGDGNAATEQAAEQATLAAQEQAYQTMMAGHDRVMPMMGGITKAQRTILAQLAEENLGEDKRELLTAASEQLQDAEDEMMDWMQSVKPLDELREEMGEDEVMTWVKEKTASIAGVESAMMSSVANANELLGMSHGHDHGDGAHDHNH